MIDKHHYIQFMYVGFVDKKLLKDDGGNFPINPLCLSIFKTFFRIFF